MVNQRSILMDKDGRYVMVMQIGTTLKLCVGDSQEEHLVDITKQTDNRIQMAFSKGKKEILLKADEEELKVVERAAGVSLTDFVLENVGGGQYFALRAVTTEKYLSQKKKRKHTELILHAKKSLFTVQPSNSA